MSKVRRQALTFRSFPRDARRYTNRLPGYCGFLHSSTSIKPVSAILHGELHWLDVPDRITYKLAVMVYRCLYSQAPRYLADHLTPASDVASRLRLRSANRQQLLVRRCRLDTYGRRAFFVAGPTVWNSSPDELRDPTRGSDSLKNSSSRQSCSVSTNVTSALEVSSNDMRYINSRFTYLLTFPCPSQSLESIGLITVSIVTLS